VATPAIFIGGGAPNWSMADENEFRVHALAGLRQWQLKVELRTNQPFSSTVAT